MAAIRDGLGRVRVAGEAIYQREREREPGILVEGCFAPMVAVTTPFPGPFLPLFSFLFALYPLASTVSPFLPLLTLDRDHPLTRPRGALGSVHESINVRGD